MPKEAKKIISRSETERTAVRELVKAARARGEDLTGPDGLLKSITATVWQTALEEELTEHLGHEKHQAPTAENGNIRKHTDTHGTHPKTVLTGRGRGSNDRSPAGPGRSTRVGCASCTSRCRSSCPVAPRRSSPRPGLTGC